MLTYADTAVRLYFICLSAMFGAVFGSFLNCAAYRIARNESFLKGRSKCPDCSHTLGPLDLIPVFSWIFSGGKCRYCGKRVSIRYPLTEIFFALMTVLCFLEADSPVLFFRNFAFGCCLFCLSLVDLEICIIPDGCLIISALAWLVAQPFLGKTLMDALMHVLCGFVFGGALLFISLLFDRILKKESMGGGDIKLFAVMGLYLGFVSSLFSLMLSCVLGLIFALVRRIGAPKGDPHFPFGPAISAATWIMLLYGAPFVDWYLGLMRL
ncbi:MAG: prepilin peptidase [Lachnospiraceae bacterium]|nr:prepilin peptidase [Lachnospiraceae bacterium]